MLNLKPCPFCGGADIYLIKNYGFHDDTAVVFCNRCKAVMFVEENDEEGINEKTQAIAVAAWNRRADNA